MPTGTPEKGLRGGRCGPRKGAGGFRHKTSGGAEAADAVGVGNRRGRWGRGELRSPPRGQGSPADQTPCFPLFEKSWRLVWGRISWCLDTALILLSRPRVRGVSVGGPGPVSQDRQPSPRAQEPPALVRMLTSAPRVCVWPWSFLLAEPGWYPGTAGPRPRSEYTLDTRTSSVKVRSSFLFTSGDNGRADCSRFEGTAR